MKTVCIPGTHSWKPGEVAEWYMAGSPWAKFIQSQGVQLGPEFIWSTSLGGIGFGDGDLTGWAAAGLSLHQLVVPPLCPERRISGDELNVVAHSHGLQVVLFACDYGLRIRNLISVGSPVRKDMLAAARKARPNIGYWLHIHSDRSDRWQIFGELFDGHLGVVREHPLADANDSVPKVGHSEILRDPTKFHFWTERGWTNRIK